MNIYKTPRSKAWRNMMVAAINAGVEREAFGLNPDENFWAKEKGAASFCFSCEFSGVPFLAAVGNAGFGELSVAVLAWPKVERFCASPYPPDGLGWGDAYAHGWFERGTGAHLQYTPGEPGIGFACRATRKEHLAALDISPRGYADHGPFFF